MGEEERLLEEDHGGSDKDEWEDDNEGLLITPDSPVWNKTRITSERILLLELFLFVFRTFRL